MHAIGKLPMVMHQRLLYVTWYWLQWNLFNWLCIFARTFIAESEMERCVGCLPCCRPVLMRKFWEWIVADTKCPMNLIRQRCNIHNTQEIAMTTVNTSCSRNFSNKFLFKRREKKPRKFKCRSQSMQLNVWLNLIKFINGFSSMCSLHNNHQFRLKLSLTHFHLT